MKTKRAAFYVVGLFLLLSLVPACGDEEKDGEPPPAKRPRTRVELLRDTTPARLSLTVDGKGGPVFLRGQRGSLFYGHGETHIATIDTTACQIERYWESQADYLDGAAENGINLLHVELWNLWEPTNPFPFLRDGDGRFRIRDAVELNQWNDDYFKAVRELVEEASARGIVVFFSLFNHYNIRESKPEYQGRPWASSPFRGANSVTGMGLPDGLDRRRRMAEFLTFGDGQGELTEVARIQKALVGRLLEEIEEENTGFELLMAPWMVNNPYIDGLGLARWENWLAGSVRAKEQQLGRDHGVLLAVTPAVLKSFDIYVDGAVNEGFEIMAWRQAWSAGLTGYENWPEIAIVSYPGFMAFGNPPFPADASLYMEERILAHRASFGDTAVLLSTDGFNRRFSPRDCRGNLDRYVEDIRHGWWNQKLDGVDLSLYPVTWAQRSWDLTRLVPAGSVHFLNWTTAEDSMKDLATGNYGAN